MSDDVNFEDSNNANKPEPRSKTTDLVEYGEFKGRKTIVLKKTPDDPYPFSFGLAKARLIVDHYEAIEEFVENGGK